MESLRKIKHRHEHLKIVVLTDSPEWIALERLSKVGLLPMIDGVCAIRTTAPRISHPNYRECITRATQRIDERLALINKDHLALNLSLPARFAKPSHKGIETVLKHLGIDGGQVILVGDKDTKEGQAAASWRSSRKVWTDSSPEIRFIRADYGNYDIGNPKYGKLAEQICSLKVPVLQDSSSVPVHRAITRADHLSAVVDEILSDAPLHCVVA